MAAPGTSKLHVTLIGSLPPHKGISPYVRDLATELAARDDIDLDVLTFSSLYPRRLYPGGDPETRDGTQAVIPGARVRRTLRWWNPLGWLVAGLTLRGTVVHAQWWSFFLAPSYFVILLLARIRGKRIVITVHNVEPHEGGLLRRLANRIVLPLAHAVVVHTDENRRTLIERGRNSRRIVTLPMGIVSSPSPVTESSDSNLALSGDAPIVLFVGNIRPYKGVSDLLEAFPTVINAVPNARLIVAGQPWAGTDDLFAKTEALNITRYVTTRLEFLANEEMNSLLMMADMVVYPYRHFDAQSAAACEALRFGKAIVVTSVGGLTELVDDPRAIVPPSSPPELARAIIDVLTDHELRQRLEADAIRKSQERSWRSVAELTAEVYRSEGAAA